MSAIHIRPYDPLLEEPAAYALWQRTVGHAWPLTLETFHHKTVDNLSYLPGDHFVAEDGQEVVGFVGTHAEIVPALRLHGGVKAILVEPAYWRQGIGRALLEHALTALKQHGVTDVRLGSGGPTYFWAGVPTNLPDAWAFFQANEWPDIERSFDLVRDLSDYTTAPDVYQRIRLPNAVIAQATDADVANIRAFEAEHFPAWLPYYQQMIDHDNITEIVLARDATQCIIGASFVMDFHQQWRRHDIAWSISLGERIGGVGPLGVAKDMRDHGIGLALAARVTELLQARGNEKSYIGYTWLTDWYGTLGYRVWRDYWMSWKAI